MELPRKVPISALLIPSVYLCTSHSLGDELLIVGALVGIVRAGKYKDIYVESSYPDKCGGDRVLLDLFQFVHSLDLGTRVNIYLYKTKEPSSKKVFGHEYLIGADCMDGYYNCAATLKRWNRLSHATGNATLLGSSFESAKVLKHCPAVQAELKSLRSTEQLQRQLNARDYTSYVDMQQYLNLSLVDAPQVRLVADLAFIANASPLLFPPYLHSIRQNALDSANKRHIIIGVNTNVHYSAQVGVLSLTAKLVSSLCNIHDSLRVDGRGISVLYITHEYRAEQNDSALALSFHLAMAAACPEVPLLNDQLSRMLNSSDARAITSLTDLVLTSRMHVSIQAVSQGIPAAIFVAHQTKFSYLHSVFGLSDYSLNCTQDMSAEELQTNILRQILNIESTGRRIMAGLSEAQAMAMRNFE